MIFGQDFGKPLAFGSATVRFHPAGRTALSVDRPPPYRQAGKQADRLAQVHALLPGAAQGGQA